MTQTEFEAATHVQALAVKGALMSVSDFDFTPGYELDRRLKADPKLLAEFVKDPAGVAEREVGLVLPKGWHLHFITDKNEYRPPEGSAEAQLMAGHSKRPWSRVEIRTAVGPGCIACCGICW